MKDSSYSIMRYPSAAWGVSGCRRSRGLRTAHIAWRSWIPARAAVRTRTLSRALSVQATTSVTPPMTLRNAALASLTLRAAYDDAMGEMRRQFTLARSVDPSCPTRPVATQ